MTKQKYDVRKHILVPENVKLSDKEKKELLETTNMEAAEKDKISKELG